MCYVKVDICIKDMYIVTMLVAKEMTLNVLYICEWLL